MKLLQQLLFFILFILFSTLISSPVKAAIPYELEFVIIFDYDDVPIDGRTDVVFELYNSDERKYFEIIRNVDFDQGVATVVVGGEDSGLVNEFFDDIDMDVSFSVLHHQLFFPVQSVPYTIRSLESNKARRIDNEELIYFDEENRRVGVNNLEPELTLDIDGGIKLGNALPTDTLENGLMYWHGNTNSFYGYVNGEAKTMSYYPDIQDQSKWTYNGDETAIYSDKSVGIGMSPNLNKLAVSGNITVQGGINIDLQAFVTDFLRTSSGDGFQPDGQLKATKLSMPSVNSWVDGDIHFTGILHGDGIDITNMANFADEVFDTQHFTPNILAENHIQDGILQLHHIYPGSISTSNIVTGNVNADYIIDYSLQSRHIVDGSIQLHHMILNEIASADIRFNVFGPEKIQDNSILTTHIVDGEISSNKIASRNIVASKIVDQSITSDLIFDGSITGSKIPINSIPSTNLDFVFPISQGGTGQTAFDHSGAVFITAAGHVSSNSNLISVVDGHLGFGGNDSDVNLLIQDTATSTMLIDSEDDYLTQLFLKNDSVTWNFTVDENGKLNINSDSTTVMTFDSDGYIGIAHQTPIEALTLSGPILLGAATATPGNYVPGTMYYSGGQFSLCLTSTSCNPITLASAYNRTLDQGYQLAQSSIVFTKDSHLSGEKLLVNDVQNSAVSGQSMLLSKVSNSMVNGTHTEIAETRDSHIGAQHSSLAAITNSDVQLNHSIADQLTASTVQLSQSSIGMVDASSVLGSHSFGALISNSDVSFQQSAAVSLDHSVIHLMKSNAHHIDDSVIELSGSDASFLSSTLAFARSSVVDRVSDSDISLLNSYVSNVLDADLMGDHQLVFDANNIKVSGDFVVSMQGHGQTIDADHVVAIGPNIHARHDHTLLINASKQPLYSDRDGQLKIQADGDVRIQFDHDMGISMVDGMGQHISDKNLKFNFTEIDPKMILQKVRELPIYYWSYKTQDKALHLGPVAQDFAKIFNYGNSETVIHSIDSDGVLLASIQALNDQLREMEKGYNNISRLNGRSSNYLTDMNQDLNSLIQRATDLDRSFFNYLYKLDQFENDYDTQVQMTQYIENVTTKIEYAYRLNRVMQPIGLALIIILGIIIGGLIQIIRYRRKT